MKYNKKNLIAMLVFFLTISTYLEAQAPGFLVAAMIAQLQAPLAPAQQPLLNTKRNRSKVCSKSVPRQLNPPKSRPTIYHQ